MLVCFFSFIYLLFFIFATFMPRLDLFHLTHHWLQLPSSRFLSFWCILPYDLLCAIASTNLCKNTIITYLLPQNFLLPHIPQNQVLGPFKTLQCGPTLPNNFLSHINWFPARQVFECLMNTAGPFPFIYNSAPIWNTLPWPFSPTLNLATL